MKLKIIACRVFEPEIDVIMSMNKQAARNQSATVPDDVDVDWLPLREHDHPDTLRGAIQEKIDAVDESYDAIILAYGLCGNALSGIHARSIPLYIPQAHDCSQILLGSSRLHSQRFGENPSRGWTSRGYMASEDNPFREVDTVMGWDLDSLISQYGEDDARYVWDTMHASDSAEDPILYFLDVPETSEPAVLRRAEEKAAMRKKTLQVIPATLDLLERLISGRGGKEILYVAPGSSITPSYNDEVIVAVQSTDDENTEKV